MMSIYKNRNHDDVLLQKYKSRGGLLTKDINVDGVLLLDHKS